jgi:hypothetical protein
MIAPVIPRKAPSLYLCLQATAVGLLLGGAGQIVSLLLLLLLVVVVMMMMMHCSGIWGKPLARVHGPAKMTPSMPKAYQGKTRSLPLDAIHIVLRMKNE